MTVFSSTRGLSSLIVSAVLLAACGSGTGPTRQIPADGSPTAPSGPGGSITLSAPAPVSPINGEQLSTLRPILTVQNATS